MVTPISGILIKVYMLKEFFLYISGISGGGKSEGAPSVDRTKWKSMQNFMNDTVRFVEMIHSYVTLSKLFVLS